MWIAKFCYVAQTTELVMLHSDKQNRRQKVPLLSDGGYFGVVFSSDLLNYLVRIIAKEEAQTVASLPVKSTLPMV